MAHRVPLATARSGAQIEAAALAIVESFQPRAAAMIMPFDVERLFECELKARTQVTPDYRELGDGLYGYTDIEEMECIISSDLANAKEEEITKRRFLRATQAHEVGHCFLHVQEFRETRAILRFRHDDKHAELTLHDQDEIKMFRNPEWQAWRFAGALLMPERCFRAAVQAKWTKRMMSNGFDVNPSFIDVRLRTLKIPTRVRNG
jgi:Zn-dependent peptidase ImmA (M78 family)